MCIRDSTNIGAGRIVYQELTRITKAIQDGDFFENSAFISAVDNAIAVSYTHLDVYKRQVLMISALVGGMAIRHLGAPVAFAHSI